MMLKATISIHVAHTSDLRDMQRRKGVL